MEFKLIYLIGILIYFVFRQFRKLQREALKRSDEIKQKAKQKPLVVSQQVPRAAGVKAEHQKIEKEKNILRQQNKLANQKNPKPFFEKPEHVVSVFKPDSDTATKAVSEVNNFENIPIGNTEFRKMIIYSEILKRPIWYGL